MPELNVSTPSWQCYVRRAYLFKQLPHPEAWLEPCLVVGISSIPGRALGFHVLLENGAVIWRLPIDALVARNNDCNDLILDYDLEELQVWDCFSPFVTAHIFDRLDRMRCNVFITGELVPGTYKFTVDWYGLGTNAEDVGNDGHKCAHIIELDKGQYVAQPNNRIVWLDSAFVTKPVTVGNAPHYSTISTIFKCEQGANK